MLVNRDSRGWIIACLLIFIAALVSYVLWANVRPSGPSGGSIMGLIYGGAGTAMMLFALLLGLRKRFRTLRIGRAFTWTRGHVWLGLLAYPIILFHCGFRWGGPFTQILMWSFTVVVATGIIGLVIQNYMPRRIFRDVQFETIFEEIDHVLSQLRQSAEKIMGEVVGASGGEAFEMEVVPAGVQVATLPETSKLAAQTLSDFYQAQIKPFLADKPPKDSKLRYPQTSRIAFEQVRITLPRAMQEPLNDLALLVEERRQLSLQKRLHHWLHGWLMIHVPISYGMMILVVVHAVYALRFVQVRW